MTLPARDQAFVLIHSPLVVPTSWLPVAQELERRGRVAVVPSLLGVSEATNPSGAMSRKRCASRSATFDSASSWSATAERALCFP